MAACTDLQWIVAAQQEGGWGGVGILLATLARAVNSSPLVLGSLGGGGGGARARLAAVVNFT